MRAYNLQNSKYSQNNISLQGDLHDVGKTVRYNHQNLSWTFKKIQLKFKWLQFFECEITDGKISSHGYGHSFFIQRACEKALSESIERLYFKKQQKLDPTIISSNGFAAAPTEKLARQNAIDELIERQILLLAWSSRQGWHRYELRSPLSKVLKSEIEKFGWRLKIFAITAKIETHLTLLCAIAHHEIFGTVFDSNLLHSRVSEIKLLQSIAKSACYAEIFKQRESPILPDIGKPNDHAEFYRNPKNDAAFDFLTKEDLGLTAHHVPKHKLRKAEPIELSGAEETQIETIFDQQTFRYVARANNKNWIPLNWGRQSIFGKNPFPHPLA